MTVVVLGAGGMLGCDLVAACRDRGMSVSGHDLPELDITLDEGLVGLPACDVLVNCAAYTDVDGAESNRDLAFAVNCDGAGRVARWCAEQGARLVHISTDYVFDGKSDRAYVEDDRVGPLNVYGQSKLEGERAVRAECPDHLIVRTQSLFGRNGANFVETIIRAAGERGKVDVVDDQISSPTYTVHLARAIIRLFEGDRKGTVHVSAGGSCSWYEFAVAILNETMPAVTVSPVIWSLTRNSTPWVPPLSSLYGSISNWIRNNRP